MFKNIQDHLTLLKVDYARRVCLSLVCNSASSLQPRGDFSLPRLKYFACCLLHNQNAVGSGHTSIPLPEDHLRCPKGQPQNAISIAWHKKLQHSNLTLATKMCIQICRFAHPSKRKLACIYTRAENVTYEIANSHLNEGSTGKGETYRGWREYVGLQNWQKMIPFQFSYCFFF